MKALSGTVNSDLSVMIFVTVKSALPLLDIIRLELAVVPIPTAPKSNWGVIAISAVMHS